MIRLLVYYDKGYVHKIKFRDCSLKRLPVIFRWYTAIRILDVSNTDLEVVLGRNFEYAENLVFLNASHNQIEELPSSLFTDSKNIEFIDFSFNKIKRIDPMVFDPVNNLKTLDLSNNSIEIIDVRLFKNLVHLKKLNLSTNSIENIESELFRGLNNLEVLWLHSNRLKTMSCDHFADISALKSLKLQFNQLRNFNSSCIRGDQLSTINVSNNKLVNFTLPANIKEVDASCNEIRFLSTKKLRYTTIFNVSRNHIENIPEIIRSLNAELIELDVSDNAVGKLNISTFAKFKNLQVLGLRNANLSNIQYATFHHQNKLRILDISGNKLKRINFEMFSPMDQTLEILNVGGNMLKNFENINIFNFPSLRQVDVGDNNFTCEYLWQFLHSLRRKHLTNGIDLQFSDENTVSHINEIECSSENHDIPAKNSR